MMPVFFYILYLSLTYTIFHLMLYVDSFLLNLLSILFLFLYVLLDVYLMVYVTYLLNSLCFHHIFCSISIMMSLRVRGTGVKSMFAMKNLLKSAVYWHFLKFTLYSCSSCVACRTSIREYLSLSETTWRILALIPSDIRSPKITVRIISGENENKWIGYGLASITLSASCRGRKIRHSFS